MNGILQDLRYALRRLSANPGFAVVAVITLGLGVGANTAIFNLVDTLVLRPIPVQNPHELTFLTFPRGEANFEATFSAAEFREISDHTREVFSGVAAFIFGGAAGPLSKPDGLTVDGETKPIQTVFVSGNFFNMLGIRPYEGRFILPSEGTAPGADPVAVLSYRYWKSRFNGDPSILNKQVLINGRPVTIVGIAPKGFFGPTPIVDMEAYLPLGMMVVETEGKTDFLNDPRVRYLVVLARLATGMTIERADASLAALGHALTKEFPRSGVGTDLQARALKPPGLLNGVDPFPKLVGLFMTLAGLVLALACLNVANLLLLHALARRREMALRTALGGSRSRLIRNMLAESVLLAVLGSIAGSIVGTFALRTLSSAATFTNFPIVLDFSFNARLFFYALAIAVLTGTVVGIVPALRVSAGNLMGILREGGRTTTGHGQRARAILVVAQVAGSLALLIVAGLFVRSLRSVQHSDLGFDARNVLNVEIDPSEIGYTKTQTTTFYAHLLSRVRALPGVQAESLAMMVPFGDRTASEGSIIVPGYVPRQGEELHASYNAVSQDYFNTMRIAILKGRDFTEGDSQVSPPVALINQAMAERFWPGKDPIGRQFIREGDPQHPVEVVGIVRNSRIEDAYSPYGPVFYVPISQNYVSAQTLQVRTAGLPQAVIAEILEIVRNLAPTMPVLSVRTMTDAVNGINGLFLFSLGARLTGGLGLLGLTLALVGIYGVMVYAAGQRTQEIGVRIALGARRPQIFWMICRQGLIIIAIGLAAGSALAVGIGRVVGDFLVGVGPTDPFTYLGVGLLLTLAALLACYIPARRAAKIDPMVALRYE